LPLQDRTFSTIILFFNFKTF